MRYLIKIKTVAMLGLGVFCFSNAFWADEMQPLVTLNGLIQETLQKNPGLSAKKKEYEAKKGKVIDSWLLEDPKFGVDVEGQPDLFQFNRRTGNEFMVMQEIPFPSKLFLRGFAASKEAEIAFEAYKEEERDLIWHVEQPYYELFTAKKTVSILEENKNLLEQIAKSASARYESGQASQGDILKAQIEISKLNIELFNAMEKEHIAQAHFSHLLSRFLKTRYAVQFFEQREKMDFSLEELEKLTLEKRPELRMFRLKSEEAKINQTLAHQEWLPDISLRWEGRQFSGDSGIQENDTFIGVTVPVWSLLKGIGGTWASANAEAKAAELTVEKMKNEILLKVHEAYSKLKSAENALAIYETSILPQAKQQVEVTLASYEAGKADFLSVMDAQRTLKGSQLEYYELFTDYGTALSDLRLAVGDDLKKIEKAGSK